MVAHPSSPIGPGPWMHHLELPPGSEKSRPPPANGTCRECPRQDSNLRPCLRRAVLYPLSYGGRDGQNSTASAGAAPDWSPPRCAVTRCPVRVPYG